MSIPTNKELRLIGTDTLTISFLRGEQWGIERTQEVFQGATWIFRPDGTFTFKPSPAANMRDDLYPIEGTCNGTGAIREFHGEKHAVLGVTASLDGILSLHEQRFNVEILYTVGARKIIRIVQVLSPLTSASTQVARANIGGFQVPAVFRFSITGQVDRQIFGPLLGTLKLLQKSADDPNPFLVTCETDSLQEVGTLYWESFTHFQDRETILSSKIILTGPGQARLEVDNNHNLISPSWSTISEDELLEGAGGPISGEIGGITIPVVAERGTLALTVQEHQLSGWAQATGKSAFKQNSIYAAQFTGQEQEIEGNLNNPMPEGTVDSPMAQFNGTWISDVFTEMQVEQQKVEVIGTYTGRGGGTITGTAQSNLLNFTWRDKKMAPGSKGWGFLRLMPDGRTLAGLWGYDEEQTKSEGILAELLQRPIPISGEDHPGQDRIDLKHRGYDLILQGKYEQALPLLKKALELYRAEIRQGARAQDAYLIDEISIQLRLLQCYFELANYQGVPSIPEVARQQSVFYDELLGYLQSSVDSYQTLLRRTLLSRTANPIKELTETALSLRHWQEQLANQAAVLQQRETKEPDLRIARMLALADALEQSYTNIFTARDAIVALEQHTPGQQEALVLALTSMADQLEQVRQHVTDDIERMKTLSASWPPDQQEFVQHLVGLLSLLPLKIEGEHRLIAQEIKGVEERVEYAWDSAFNLSQWLERWRTRLSADEEKIKALDEGQPFFQKLIQFFVDMENAIEALTLSERARARAFADLLAARASRQDDVVRIVAGSSQVITDRQITKEEIVQIVQERNSFIIEYFFTEHKLVIWTITSAGNITSVISSISRNDLELLVEEFSHLVQELEYSDQRSTRLFEILQQLYHALIMPVADQLAALPNTTTVVIKAPERLDESVA